MEDKKMICIAEDNKYCDEDINKYKCFGVNYESGKFFELEKHIKKRNKMTEAKFKNERKNKINER